MGTKCQFTKIKSKNFVVVKTIKYERVPPSKSSFELVFSRVCTKAKLLTKYGFGPVVLFKNLDFSTLSLMDENISHFLLLLALLNVTAVLKSLQTSLGM